MTWPVPAGLQPRHDGVRRDGGFDRAYIMRAAWKAARAGAAAYGTPIREELADALRSAWTDAQSARRAWFCDLDQLRPRTEREALVERLARRCAGIVT